MIEKLAESYGWKWETLVNEWLGSFAKNPNTKGYDARVWPFYFLYGGRIYSGFLDRAGGVGNLWSFTNRSVDSAYDLHLDGNTIFPNDGAYYAYGFSIRCLAR